MAIMTKDEAKYFTDTEMQLYDITTMPLTYILKSLFIKIRRKTWGKIGAKNDRIVWTVSGVSDVTDFPATFNVRNYWERNTIRSVLQEITQKHHISSACEFGCGYGRIIMVLKEFADMVVGFEREEHFIKIAKSLLPDITFYKVESFDDIESNYDGTFDLSMTNVFLQHLTDEKCQKTIECIKKMTADGHVLLIEKTDEKETTINQANENEFISRARTLNTYKRMMEPYKLIYITRRILEPTYPLKRNPCSLMLFKDDRA